MWFTGHDALSLLLNCGEEGVCHVDVNPLAPIPFFLRIPFTFGSLEPVDMPSGECYDGIVEVGIHDLHEGDVGILEITVHSFHGLLFAVGRWCLGKHDGHERVFPECCELYVRQSGCICLDGRLE